MKVFLDANVFVHTWTLDAILSLSECFKIEPCWSQLVQDECLKAVSTLWPDRTGSALASFEAANRFFPSALVSGYEHRLGTVELPDPDDRHVVAAALEAGCETIVTYNLRDFPSSALAPLGLRAVHPDDLLMELVVEDAEGAFETIGALVDNKRHPPRTMAEEAAGLARNRLTRFAEFLLEGRQGA